MFNLSETVLIVDCHLTRSFTVSFQLCKIFPVFKMHLQLSLKRSLGRPIGREPSASSPYNNRLQVLLSSIRETCPSHRKRLCASKTSSSALPKFRIIESFFKFTFCNRMIEFLLNWKLFELIKNTCISF